MQDRVTYEFAIIRFVPKVEREEFINIGALLFSKRKKYLGIKYSVDTQRLKAFSENIDQNIIIEYLKAWEDICKGGSHWVGLLANWNYPIVFAGCQPVKAQCCNVLKPTRDYAQIRKKNWKIFSIAMYCKIHLKKLQ